MCLPGEDDSFQSTTGECFQPGEKCVILKLSNLPNYRDNLSNLYVVNQSSMESNACWGMLRNVVYHPLRLNLSV